MNIEERLAKRFWDYRSPWRMTELTFEDATEDQQLTARIEAKAILKDKDIKEALDLLAKKKAGELKLTFSNTPQMIPRKYGDMRPTDSNGFFR